ncbi:hypothetical protein B0H16DRAFT_241942 [Mycena metata]|uniref:Uncharacterized protein n=1 Tax=Mycena metata TaxID=1033252 RepID=A0AAD7HW56_9AGAR|nr:hypothetical protein B0H16DRAFT_241942 [Mycena metata]
MRRCLSTVHGAAAPSCVRSVSLTAHPRSSWPRAATIAGAGTWPDGCASRPPALDANDDNVAPSVMGLVCAYTEVVQLSSSPCPALCVLRFARRRVLLSVDRHGWTYALSVVSRTRKWQNFFFSSVIGLPSFLSRHCIYLMSSHPVWKCTSDSPLTLRALGFVQFCYMYNDVATAHGA